MEPDKIPTYIQEIVTMCVISITKTAIVDMKDEAALRKALTHELTLGFAHLLQ